MKKILLALIVLGAGAIAFARLNLLASQRRTSATHCRAECGRLASQVDELAATATDLRAQVEAKKTRLAQTLASPTGSAAAASALSRDVSQDSWTATSAELRLRFGIAWTNSAEYILLSKAALKNIYLQGVDQKGIVTPTACAVLGLTPTERATIEAALKRVEAEHAAWMATAVQRVEPAGDVLADYRLPANPKLAQQIEYEGTALLTETLGPDRTKLLQEYAGAWCGGHGNLGEKGIRFTVRRRTEGTQPVLWYQQEEQDGTSSSCDVSPGDFPDLLRSLLPGGWRDLAQREGFPLPEVFDGFQ